MSQCVPNWDLDENTNSARLAIRGDLNAESAPTEETMLDYEVAELTWENGQLAMHGLGPPRVTGKPTTKYAWEKPRAGGTLESIVNQATCVPPGKTPEDRVLWLDHHRATANLAMDALVPCSNRTHSADENSTQVPDPDPTRGGALGHIGSWDGSCSGVVGKRKEAAAATAAAARKRTRVESSLNQSVSGSETFERESRQVTVDTWEMDTSPGSHENTSSRKPLSSRTRPTTVDDHDSVSHSRPRKEAGSEDENKGKTGRCSISTKRSRAAAIHNQSERKRRDRINQRMKTLQKLVPNSSKTDKASMLDEVIEYLKQLQAQVQMMTKMSSIPHMMMPMTMQQLQLSMMAHMGMGMGMGMGVMDINSMNRSGHAATAAAIPSMIHPAAFLPMTASWDTSGDRLHASSGVLPDPFATFLAYQTRQQQQPMNLEAYNRMAALYQQLQNQFTQLNSKT